MADACGEVHELASVQLSEVPPTGPPGALPALPVALPARSVVLPFPPEVLPAQPGAQPAMLPAPPPLSDLLPGGGLRRGCVIAAPQSGLLCIILVAAASAAGAWCAVVGMPELGMLAAADAGVNVNQLLLVADPGPKWPHVAAALLEGCELVLLRPPAQPSAQVARRLTAHARRNGAILVVAGDWAGAHLWLRFARPRWVGIGAGHGRIQGRRALVAAGGRGAGAQVRTQWWWLPGPNGAAAIAEQDAHDRWRLATPADARDRWRLAA